MTESRRAAGDEPLVSVIIPTFNRWPMVCESIDSALAQDYPNFEVIVVDDGSSDETEEELPRRYGDRVRYLRQANQGPSVARNTGIEAAQGEYIAFLDSDDLWDHRKLSIQVEALADKPQYGFVYSACRNVTADGMMTACTPIATHRGRTGDNFALMLECHPIMTSAIMVRRCVLHEVGGFDPDILSGQDTDLWLRLSMRHEGLFLRRRLVSLRLHPRTLSRHALATGLRARGSARTYEKLIRGLPPEREEHRTTIEGRWLEARLQLAAIEHRSAEPDVFIDVLRAEWARRPTALDSFHAHEALAVSVLSRGQGWQECAAVVSRSLAAQAGNRWRGMFLCAMSRRLFLGHRLGAGARWAMKALVVSPAAFARHLLPTLPRAIGSMVRQLRSMAPRAVKRGRALWR